jgi:hypothetical protein
MEIISSFGFSVCIGGSSNWSGRDSPLVSFLLGNMTLLFIYYMIHYFTKTQNPLLYYMVLIILNIFGFILGFFME